MTRHCKHCDRDLPPEAFAKNQYACRECASERWKAYKAANPEKERARQRRLDKQRMSKKVARNKADRTANPDKWRDIDLRTKYGISLAEQKALLQEQGGGCGICRSAEARSMHQDHCHATGLHRGVLCQPCNHVIGFFREQENLILAAAAYLDEAAGRIQPPYAGAAASAFAAFSGDLSDPIFETSVHLCPECQQRHPVTHYVKGKRNRLGAQGPCSTCRGIPPVTPDVALMRVTKYGIPAWQQIVLDAAFENRCAICSLPDVHRKVLHTDHDHATGLIRGLLCGRCNRGLGAAKDEQQTLRRAVEYLSEWRERHAERLAERDPASSISLAG